MSHPLWKSTLTALTLAGLSPVVAQADNTFCLICELERAGSGDITPYTEPPTPVGPTGVRLPLSQRRASKPLFAIM
jgi:hypothetical protein